MSAWRIGTEAAAAANTPDAGLAFEFGPVTGETTVTGDTTGNNDAVKEAIDRLTKWIPGDALALYVAAVTALAASEGAKPSPVLLIIFVLLSAFFVVGATFASTGKVPRSAILPAVLASVAFAIWALSVPFSGWQRWSLVGDNQAEVAIGAAVAGILFGFVAEGFTKRAAGRV